jgi:hypothetical protein
MQVLEPLAIGDVGLPAWHVLHVLCVDEVNFKAARFQDLVNGNPVNACRLHRHGANPTLHKPVGQRMQIASEAGKAADGLRVSVSAYGDVQFARANVNAGSIRV